MYCKRIVYVTETLDFKLQALEDIILKAVYDYATAPSVMRDFSNVNIEKIDAGHECIRELWESKSLYWHESNDKHRPVRIAELKSLNNPGHKYFMFVFSIDTIDKVRKEFRFALHLDMPVRVHHNLVKRLEASGNNAFSEYYHKANLINSTCDTILAGLKGYCLYRFASINNKFKNEEYFNACFKPIEDWLFKDDAKQFVDLFNEGPLRDLREYIISDETNHDDIQIVCNSAKKVANILQKHKDALAQLSFAEILSQDYPKTCSETEFLEVTKQFVQKIASLAHQHNLHGNWLLKLVNLPRILNS